MDEQGLAPPDLTTPLGKFRALIGDLEFQPYDPPIEGVGQYRIVSDAEIQSFLDQTDGSLPRAVATYYLTLAGRAAMESKSVSDHDLRVDLTKRAADLRELALLWFGRADDEDANAGSEAMVIVPVGPRSRHRWPEASARPLY